MAAVYKQFLAAPSSSLLADNASLHYITTTTSFKGAADIGKHLSLLQKQVAKKKQDVLNAVEGQGAAVFEVDTALEFQTSGGVYLPNLDDNFLSDRVAYLSITHFVTFDGDGKISQIRQQWDQGSLLKQLDIIGKTGRNWPIKDSREQLQLIQTSLKSAGAIPHSQDHNDVVIRTRSTSSNVLRDPHATLHMMGTREEIENIGPDSVASPYAGKKQNQRGFTDILGDDPAGEHYFDRLGHARSPSKVGGGKNFQPMRIFDGQEEVVEDDTPKGKNPPNYIKPNPRKYQHFDFADGSDPQDAPTSGVSFDEKPKSKHDSQWSFDDFVTPSKPQASKTLRHQEVRHWDTDRDAIESDTPAPAARARRDAETHFELQDDGERVDRPNRAGARQKGSAHNDGLGLYKNQLFDRDDETSGANRALGNITNLGGRGKDFDAHWDMNDESPAAASQQSHGVSNNQKKVLKMMDASWSNYDESPKQQKENSIGRLSKPEQETGINIAGDGMGGRKGTNRDWLYGDGEEEPPKPTTARRANASQQQQRSLWDF